MQKLKGRWGTGSAAKFRLKQLHAQQDLQEENYEAQVDAEFDAYIEEDETYQQALGELRSEIDLGYPTALVERRYLATFDFRNCDAVVVIGPDGLVANTAKYVGDLPIVAVNPDPNRIDGVLLPFQLSQARSVLQKTLKNAANVREISLAEVELNDGQKMLAFNDFFVGRQSHASARYTLQLGDAAESHSSSGLIVATGAGSTGWLSSVFNMARGVNRWVGGKMESPPNINWEERRLAWVVREPFVSRYSQADFVAGEISEGERLTVESLMPQGGVIFSDGIESDFLEFNSGVIARIGLSQQRARLVV